MFEHLDQTADEAIQGLNEANAVANAHDIARLRAIAACDRKRVYRRDDSHDMAHWLSIELGISRWKAARWVTAAYALDELPLSTAAYERGELSTDKFVELARFATRATEKKLLSWAKRTSPAGIRARADQELRIPREDVEQAEKWRLLEWEWAEGNTGFSFWGSLPDDEAGLFVTGIERMMERLAVTPEEGGSTREMRRADALVALISASIANDPDPDKATLVVHTTIDGILEGDSNGVLHGGLPIPPEAVALAACDARVQTVLHDENDNIFHVSSPSYVVPKWLRRQVEHRDGYRCTFPNCGRKGFTEVHHIVSWPRGITELSNLTLLCHFHHRLVHIHGWHVQMTEGGLTRWFRPNWTPYQPGASPPPRGYADNQDHHVDQLLAEGSGA